MSDVKKTILLIDTDETQLLIAEAVLKHYYEIIPVKSGGEALKLFQKGLVPDLVLLDMLTPKMDGWETYNKIRALCFSNGTPIVFLTHTNEKKEKKGVSETGAADYIMKPYVKEDLMHRVGSIIGFSISDKS